MVLVLLWDYHFRLAVVLRDYMVLYIYVLVIYEHNLDLGGLRGMFGMSTVWILVLEALRGMFGLSTVYIWVLVGLKGMFGMSTVWIWILEGLKVMFGLSTVWIWVLGGLKGMFGVFIGFVVIETPQNVFLGGFKKCAHTPTSYTTTLQLKCLHCSRQQ